MAVEDVQVEGDTGGVVEGFSPELCAPFWDNELLAPGFNKFNALARGTQTVATLIDATDGDLDRAPIYTEFYAPLGVADDCALRSSPVPPAGESLCFSDLQKTARSPTQRSTTFEASLPSSHVHSAPVHASSMPMRSAPPR